MIRHLIPAIAAILVLAAPDTHAAAKIDITKAKTVLFLGDSITHSGHYVSIVEARLREMNGNRIPLIINLGLPSETCSGLSEPDHPFPRPTVHERLDRALEKIKPDFVLACYGMNDGIYYPFSEERFAAYRAGIDKLIRKVKATGAKLVLMTPPPFDPLPLRKKGKILPAGREKYAWFEIYENYDSEVLARYAAWLKTQADKVEAVIDVHSPILAAVKAKRKTDPEFVLSGDGVHIDFAGHVIFARGLMKGIGLGENAEPNPALLKLVEEKRGVAHLAWLTHVGHKRPGPNSKLKFEDAMAKADAVEKKIAAWFQKHGR